jgi:putative FmdB family regulatory protein
MPIFEYACPKCRVVFDFLCRQAARPKRSPKCPRCGNKKMKQEISRFAISRGGGMTKSGKAGGAADDGSEPPMPDLDDPKLERAMMQMEKEMSSLDENNPKHLAHMMKKMKEIMPGAVPKELDIAIRRLEAGEDPEKIEEDMGDLLGDMPEASGGQGVGGYSHDEGLYDY